MKLKDWIAPFYVWKRAFEKPFTVPKPLKERPGSPRYRGFHQNDLDTCIGCGTCSSICQNHAIDMVPVDGIETHKGDSGLRPRIDYGRCCWCALCVDICPTTSLSMSNEYVWIDTDADVFRFIPGSEKKPWDSFKKGYKREEEYQLVDPRRIEMEMLPPEERVKSFLEMVKGYSREQAQKEADRCIQCGICTATCPAHMDIPGYIKAVRENKIEDGLKLMYETNPMPAMCGRVCTHQCEEDCALAHTGDAISIRWLKRYLADQVELDDYSKAMPVDILSNGKQIAIIGAGPGGLSAAYYLRLLGYEITIYEANDKGGGMTRYGIPEYRLPYDQLDKDIEYILSLGVEIKYNTRVGKDISFQEIHKESDAVLISIGLMLPYKMEIPGEDLPGNISGLEVLDKITRGEKVHFEEKVAVIGGGNVAMDSARTARTFGADVTVLYRRRIEDMPADEEEIIDAQQEKVTFITQAIPLRIEQAEDKRLSFIYGLAEMVDQGEGKRPKPVLIEGKEFSIVVDMVISAIGQGADFSFLPMEYEKLFSRKNQLKIDEFFRTRDSKIFASGDIANQTKDAISAIADGHRAARSIDHFLKNL
ncbi:MAG TPA: 4Fe-4S dicluster domain-containing protein [Candidatus Cloacimonetes bacterium]|nr:FAD-dependent oxidoreductase [Candidatus Cloacimonadota bacterium]HHE40578.1 4Fe-4S dicluster domain-containing protein [Candidatus Cloacimonadota bacterium]